MALAGDFQQGFAIVQPGVRGLGIAFAQQRQVVTGATAGVEHGLGLDADVLQPSQHATGDLAVQELGLRQVAAAGELPRHVGGDQGERRRGGGCWQGHFGRARVGAAGGS